MKDWLFVEGSWGHNSVKWLKLYKTATVAVTSINVNTQWQETPSRKMFYRLTDAYFSLLSCSTCCAEPRWWCGIVHMQGGVRAREQERRSTGPAWADVRRRRHEKTRWGKTWWTRRFTCGWISFGKSHPKTSICLWISEEKRSHKLPRRWRRGSAAATSGVKRLKIIKKK